MYDIHVYDPDELDELPDDVHDDVIDEITEVANYRNPNSYRNTEKLNSNRDLYKLKVRNHRVIFGTVSRYLVVFRVRYRGDSKVYRDIDQLEDLWDQAHEDAKAACP